MGKALMLGAAALGLSACATPSARGPEVPTAPDRWAFASAQTETAQNPWWRGLFPDPALAALVEEAGQGPSVAATLARREAAEARLRAALQALAPTGAVRVDLSGRVEDAAESVVAGAEFSIGYSHNLAGAERWRVRAAAARVEAADATLAAARLDARVTAARLIAAALAVEGQQAAARRGLAAAEESLSLAQARVSAGLDSALAAAQARAARDRQAALLPPLAQARLQARLGLEAVLARSLGGQALTTPEPFAQAQTPFTDTPVAVLARRPDMRLALADLAAADGEAAAAEADRWPTMSIATMFGFAAADRPPDGAVGMVTGSLLAPMLGAARREALSDAAAAEAEAAAAEARRAFAAAIADVETSLVRLHETRTARQARAAVVVSAQEQSDLARSRYLSGLTSFLEVTFADAALAEAEFGLAQADGALLEAQILLAGALGLGADF